MPANPMTAREAALKCAEICERQQWLYGGRSHSMMACTDCAAAIRAYADKLKEKGR